MGGKKGIMKHKSASVLKMADGGGTEDQRAIETRRKLDRALLELLHRRSYDNIRVSDITRKALVGRSTYYAHYASKDELLKSQFFRSVAPMIRVKAGDTCLLDCTQLFAHIKEVPRIYLSIIGTLPWSRGSGVLRECIEQHVMQSLYTVGGSIRRVDVREDIPCAMVARFISHGLMAVLEYFMRSGTEKSAEELQKIFYKLVVQRLGNSGQE